MYLTATIKSWFKPSIKPEKLLEDFALSDDKYALEQLVQTYNQSLYHYLLSLSDPEVAEDVLHSTWIKVMKSANLYKRQSSVKSWLFTIARNSLIDEMRKKQRWQHVDFKEEHHQSETLEQDIISGSTLNLFNKVLEQLPLVQREAFIFQQEGLTIQEIALITESKVETIKSRIRYARQTIKQQLEKEHD